MQDAMRENGMMDFLSIKWKGREIPNFQESDLMTLSAGQTLLIFVIMLGAFGLTALIFCLELVDAKIRGFRITRKRPKEHKKHKKQRNKKKKTKSEAGKQLTEYPFDDKKQDISHWIHVKMDNIE